MSRKMILLTEGAESYGSAKTAINLLRYKPEEVVSVLDRARAGQSAMQAFGVGGAIPVVASLDDAGRADTLVIGIAPSGGKLPAVMKAIVLEAIARKMRIVSGLHEFLSQDPQIVAAANRYGAELVDVRKNTEREVAHRRDLDERCLRIHTVGNDCNVGKMVVSLELSLALNRAGHDAKFIATGQTGIMIEGDGCPVDAVVVDFINGAAERLVLAHQHHGILLIEGQGSISHPRYSAVTLGLLHGSMPDGLILCYEMGRETVSGMSHIRLPSLAALRQWYETMANIMHPCRVLGVAMNSRRHSQAEADQERERVSGELGLPVCDVLRHGPETLVQAVLEHKAKIGK